MNKFVFGGLLSLITSCQPQQQDIPEIRLSMQAPEISLKISDFTDHVRIVPLETNDTVLLPDRFNVAVSEKYIITIGQEEINQFTTEGKHLRKLLRQGRGPNEYEWISNSKIDDSRDLLYAVNGIRGLLVWDLTTGRLIARKPFAIPITRILKIDGDTLLCQPYPSPGDSVSYRLCRMTTDGALIDGIRSIHPEDLFSDANCYYTTDGQLRYKFCHSDTLFTTINGREEIAAFLQYTNPESHYVPMILPYFENQQGTLILVTPIHLVKNAQGEIESVSIINSAEFWADKQNGEARIFKEIWIDTLQQKLPIKPISFPHNWIVMPVTALECKDALQKLAKKGTLSPFLQSLSQTIQENDNPILFIGKCK